MPLGVPKVGGPRRRAGGVNLENCLRICFTPFHTKSDTPFHTRWPSCSVLCAHTWTFGAVRESLTCVQCLCRSAYRRIDTCQPAALNLENLHLRELHVVPISGLQIPQPHKEILPLHSSKSKTLQLPSTGTQMQTGTDPAQWR